MPPRARVRVRAPRRRPREDEYIFPTVVECTRCQAIKEDGRRCTRTTCKYADKCWQHTKRDEGVEIKKDEDHPERGYGMWAVRDLPAGTRFRYGRPGLDNVEPYLVNQMEDAEAVYVLCNDDNTQCIDARSTQSGLARWVNDIRPDRANARLVYPRGENAQPSLRLTERVRAGREIRAWYGPVYNRHYRL